MASSAAQLGAGLAMGQQLAQAMAPGASTPPALPPGPASPPPLGVASANPLPELLSPAEAAKVLGVNESDVLSALAEGSLKGKKIGTAWRITRAAMDDFLKN